MGQLLVDSQKLPFPVKCPLKSLSGSPGFDLNPPLLIWRRKERPTKLEQTPRRHLSAEASMKDLRMVWGAGAGGFNVHSVYGMQDRFGDVWRWISEGATVCETSCAALDSQLKDGTGPEMYGRGNGHVLAGTRYYPPRTTPLGRQYLHQYSAPVSRLPAWFSGRRRSTVLGHRMMVDMLDESGSRIRSLLLCLDTLSRLQ